MPVSIQPFCPLPGPSITIQNTFYPPQTSSFHFQPFHIQTLQYIPIGYSPSTFASTSANFLFTPWLPPTPSPISIPYPAPSQTQRTPSQPRTQPAMPGWHRYLPSVTQRIPSSRVPPSRRQQHQQNPYTGHYRRRPSPPSMVRVPSYNSLSSASTSPGTQAFNTRRFLTRYLEDQSRGFGFSNAGDSSQRNWDVDNREMMRVMKIGRKRGNYPARETPSVLERLGRLPSRCRKGDFAGSTGQRRVPKRFPSSKPSPSAFSSNLRSLGVRSNLSSGPLPPYKSLTSRLSTFAESSTAEKTPSTRKFLDSEGRFDSESLDMELQDTIRILKRPQRMSGVRDNISPFDTDERDSEKYQHRRRVGGQYTHVSRTTSTQTKTEPCTSSSFPYFTSSPGISLPKMSPNHSSPFDLDPESPKPSAATADTPSPSPYPDPIESFSLLSLYNLATLNPIRTAITPLFSDLHLSGIAPSSIHPDSSVLPHDGLDIPWPVVKAFARIGKREQAGMARIEQLAAGVGLSVPRGHFVASRNSHHSYDSFAESDESGMFSPTTTSHGGTPNSSPADSPKNNPGKSTSNLPISPMESLQYKTPSFFMSPGARRSLHEHNVAAATEHLRRLHIQETQRQREAEILRDQEMDKLLRRIVELELRVAVGELSMTSRRGDFGEFDKLDHGKVEKAVKRAMEVYRARRILERRIKQRRKEARVVPGV